jgi:hypothetical protein
MSVNKQFIIVILTFTPRYSVCRPFQKLSKKLLQVLEIETIRVSLILQVTSNKPTSSQ